MTTKVFFKDLLTDTEVQFDLVPSLQYGETLEAIELLPVTPVSPQPLVATLLSGVLPLMTVSLKGGDESTAYGITVKVTTSVRVFTELLAVTVQSKGNELNPYTTENIEAVSDLVGSIEAGKAAIGSALFAFPPDVDPSGGYVTWELLSQDGTVWSRGNAFEYVIKSNGISNMVNAKSVINVPGAVPPSLDNQKYLLRYCLTLNHGDSNESQYFSAEYLDVTSYATVPLGTASTVEIKGDQAGVSIVIDDLYENVWVELYSGNKKIGEQRIVSPERVSSGYFYGGIFDTSRMPVSLVPYSVLWKYWNGSQPPIRESAELWIVNPSILQAYQDVLAKINKARTTLYGAPDLLYPVEVIMTWLRRACDAFNGAYGHFTSFTMTNALGSIREFWLLYAELYAIESQYLAEGEKAFNFTGAAISLDVDKTQYLDSAAGKIRGQLDNELKPFKQNLIMKGNTGGDGSADPAILQRGAMGSVGITITPATGWRGRGGWGGFNGRF